jgi:hypothetical protein
VMAHVYSQPFHRVALKEAAPAISRVAVLWNPDHADPEFRETRRSCPWG